MVKLLLGMLSALGKVFGGMTENMAGDLTGGVIGESSEPEPPPDLIEMIKTLNYSLKWLLWIPFILGMVISFYFAILAFKEAKKS